MAQISSMVCRRFWPPVQLLTYSANYPLSSEATQELFTVFIAQSAHFGPRFAKRVCQVGAVQELIRQRHAKAAGAAV